MRRRNLLLPAGALAGLLSLGLLSSAPAPQSRSEPFTAEVVRGELSIEVELSGTFVAEDKDEIRMEPKTYRGDLIITSLLAEGSEVAEGDVLIEFDPTSLEDSLEEARDEVSAKTVARDKAAADLEAFEIERETTLAQNQGELKMEQRELGKARAQVALELSDKEQSILDAQESLADARVDFEQLVQLYEERELHTATENILIARERRRLRNLERGLEKTKAEVEIWKKFDQSKTIDEKELEVVKKEAELRKSRIRLEADRGEKLAEVAKTARALEKAEREVSELEEDQAGLRVTAPRDGIVFYGTIGGDSYSDVIIYSGSDQGREMQVGGRVRTHQILMTVASMDSLSVKMSVLENDIQHMNPGLPISIRPDAFPSLAIQGRLTKVDQIASRTGFLSDVREFPVRGSYEGVFEQLRSGMNCRITVHADAVPDAVLVPVLAVFSEGGEFYCLVRDGKDTRRRPIQLGATNGTSVQILEGVRPGEVVTLFDPGEE